MSLPIYVTIEKGGLLSSTYWDSSHGEFRSRDVSGRLLGHLVTPCRLAKDLTMGDLFRLISNNLAALEPILGNWVEEIIKESQAPITVKKSEATEASENDTGYEDLPLERLELHWQASVAWEQDGHDEADGVPPPGSPVTSHLDGLTFPGFHGLSVEASEDVKTGHGDVICHKGDRITYSVSFTPANELAPLPLVMDESLAVYEDIFSPKDKTAPERKEPLLEAGSLRPTLLQVLYGIIWEMSWYGSPDRRNETRDELDETMAAVRFENGQLVGLEDVDNEGIEDNDDQD